jgi:hypothetical protein
MALKFISPNDSDNSQDLPWVNEYVKTVGDPGDSSLVTKVVKGEKGFLIIAQAFKGFLFSKSSIAKHLEEALEIWITNSVDNYPLFAVASPKGKIELAVDDELESSVWVKTDNTWEQKIKKNQAFGSNTQTSNPFLPKNPPPTTNGRKAK